jgi:hypothetical protein
MSNDEWTDRDLEPVSYEATCVTCGAVNRIQVIEGLKQGGGDDTLSVVCANCENPLARLKAFGALRVSVLKQLGSQRGRPTQDTCPGAVPASASVSGSPPGSAGVAVEV